jgi:hypothetical protein
MKIVPTALTLGLASLILVACGSQSDTATASTDTAAATLEAANDTAAATAEAATPAEAK